MKTTSERLAPIGLILTVISLLAAGGLFIVRNVFDLWVQVSLGLAVIGLALFVLLDPERARKAITGRQARYGSNALIMTIAFLGILVVVNYLGFKNNQRWDLTEDKEHTLSQESIDVLATLPEPVTVEAYFTVNYPTDTAKKLLDSYQFASKDKFSYTFVDPDQDPVAAQNAKVTRDGTIVLKMGDLQEQVTYASEQEITSALVKLANPGTRAVYFLTGHGEYDIDNASSQQGYSQVKTTLEAKNYTVNTLNLISNPVVPRDALAIIIAGARKPLSAEEIALLKAYVDGGGSLVALVEPRPVTDFGEQPDLLAEYLKEQWGIELSESFILDPSINNPVVSVASYYAQHSITDKLQNVVTMFPSGRALVQGEVPEDVTLVDLIKTSESSWAETDYASLDSNSVSPDQASDLMGPLTIAIAGTNSKNDARVVVVGDADFAGDQNFTQYGNGDLILNMIDWAATQENLLNLTPKQATERFTLPPQRYSLGLILLLSIFLLPGAVVASGIVTWIDRRRRG
ncbi:MAG TPA: GldG family protein [Anaerolineaceae bacterium]|nr:GldG family protein [Anaerolineaceae bacterium]